MDKEKAAWQRMWFNTNKVWVSMDPGGKPVEENGKVLIKYQLNQDYEYWVHAKGIHPLNAPPDRKQGYGKKAKKPVSVMKDKENPQNIHNKRHDEKGTILIYTDGASSGNPGPSGIGVVLKYHARRREISRYIGQATNNIAELEAIRAGLKALKTTRLPVRIFTDSSYAHGLLTKGWKPRKNIELVEKIRVLIKKYENLKLIKVDGHAGIEENERADTLATSAVKNRT